MRRLYRLRSRLPETFRERLRRIRAVFLSLDLSAEGDFPQSAEEISASARISIVIAALDPPPLERCLASVERFAAGAEVILVDDGSVLPETKAVIQDSSRGTDGSFCATNMPQGHSRACEAGARLATRPYLCLLNADTILTPWSWRAAVEAFEADPRIAVTGPTTSHCTTPQLVERAELCRHYWSDAQIFNFGRKYVSNLPQRCWVDLPEVGGFAFFIRRDLWERLEGFDPNLPDYGNEVELCRRVSKMGLRIVWTRNSYIHHLGNQTYSSARFGPKFISTRSWHALEYIEAKHGEQVQGAKQPGQLKRGESL